MKLFLKEFGIWMGGALLLTLLIGLLLQGVLPQALLVIIYWLLPIIGIIVAITRLKIEHGAVSFGKSLGAGVLIALAYQVLNLIITIIRFSDGPYFDLGSQIEVSLMQALFLSVVVLYILLAAGVWYTLKKAGKPGYAFLIPIYNIIVMLEIAKKPMWWIAMFLIPIANIVFAIMMLNAVSKNFGKDEGFTVGLVFLSPIFWAILGYGDAQYLGGAESKGNSQGSEDVLDDL